jgi:hypothetical protein
MSIANKQIIWVQFAAAALKASIETKLPDVTSFSAAVADKMTEQWDLRYGDGAFLLEGQSECGNCHKPLPPGSEFTPSVDGVKFCSVPCLKSSGREE